MPGPDPDIQRRVAITIDRRVEPGHDERGGDLSVSHRLVVYLIQDGRVGAGALRPLTE